MVLSRIPISRPKEEAAERGAAVVEIVFGIVALIFVTVIGIDLLRAGYTAFFVEHTVKNAARWAILNQTGSAATREEGIRDKFEEYGARYELDIDRSRILICPISDANSGCTANSAGAPGDIFVLRYSHPIKVRLLGVMTNIEYEMFAQNEPGAS